MDRCSVFFFYHHYISAVEKWLLFDPRVAMRSLQEDANLEEGSQLICREVIDCTTLNLLIPVERYVPILEASLAWAAIPK